eukprot:Selendium_serpulae@DN5122_c1_g1_i5.p2
MGKKEGDAVPSVEFQTRVKPAGKSEFEWKTVKSEDIFKGKRIVVFALPGAFTPTCSSTHLPGYEADYKKIKEKGVDEIYCLSVNDSFVMNAWAKDQMIEHVKLLPDGNGDFSKGMGMLVSKKNLGFGPRSWRYSMIVKDMKIEKIFVEDGFGEDAKDDPFKVSDSETIVKYLSS